jgi:hypothetical protein
LGGGFGPRLFGGDMLFSDKHQAQQTALHNTGTYGVGGNPDAHYDRVINAVAKMYGCKTLLDYGCGSRMVLKPLIEIEYTPYDIIPELYKEPKPHDMVIAVDVLEHIEPEYLDAVLDHIEGLTEKVLFASVHTQPALKTLPDGRNAHLIQEPMEDWIPRFTSRFTVQQIMRVSNKEFFVIATRK